MKSRINQIRKLITLTTIAMLIALSCVVPAFATSIDIKPGSNPSSINLGSKGLVPVGLLNEPPCLNVYDVNSDLNSIFFGTANPVRYSFEDVDGDGFTDYMLFLFEANELNFDNNDYSLHFKRTGINDMYCQAYQQKNDEIKIINKKVK